MKKALQILFTCAILCIIYIAQGNSGGPSWGYTSAPSSSNCRGCHSSYSLQNSGPLHKKIDLRMNSFKGGGYLPDSSYEFLLVFKDTLHSKAGFQMTVLDENNDPAGTFGTLDIRTQVGSKFVSGKTRSFIGHTNSGNSHQASDSISWRIKWTAPSKNIGKITFYLNVVSANKASGNRGDFVFAKTFTAEPSNLLPQATISLKTLKACRRSSLSFEASSTGSPTIYDWSFPGATPSSSAQSKPNVEYLNSGAKVVYLTTTNAYGKGGTDTFNFNVLKGPFRALIEQSKSGFARKCNLEDLTLSVPVRSNEDYIWLPDSVLQDSFVVTKPGTYSVRSVLKTTGCTADASPIRIINYDSTYFSIDKISSDTLCAGVDSIKFNLKSSSIIKSSFVLDGADTVGLNTNTISLKPELFSGAKIFKVFARDSVNCAMSAKNVTFFFKERESAPQLLVSTKRNLQGVQLNWNSMPSALAYEVSIDGKSYFPSNSGGNDTFYTVTGLNPNTTFSYDVRGVTFSHCLSSKAASGVDSSLACGPLNYAIVSDSLYCEGDTAKIEISGVSIPNHSLYVNGSLASNSMSFTFSKLESQSAAVFISDSTGFCSSDTQIIDIFYDAIDRHSIDTTYRPVCAEASTSQDIQFSINPKTSKKYSWYVNGSLQVSGTSAVQLITIKNNDQVFVRADNGACQANTDTATISYLEALNCKIAARRKEDGIYSIASEQNGVLHSWFINGIEQSSILDSFDYDFSSLAGTTADITHVIDLGLNCSCIDSISVDLSVLSVNKPNSTRFTVFPNPASDFIRVSSNSLGIDIPYQILSSNGRMVKEGCINGRENKIKVNGLAMGLYQLVLGENRQDAFKIVVMH